VVDVKINRKGVTRDLPVCIVLSFHCSVSCLQCFDAVGWAAGRASGL